MARHILDADMAKLAEYGFVGGADEEEGIEERISLVRAKELLEAWKKLKVEAE